MTIALDQQFLHPPEEFTPIPFWFWNDHLTTEEIKRQIHDFYDKGVTGFVLHPRIGIPKDTVYLSDDFMELVQAAVMEASRLDMTVILYDEAMYPSGSANGLVVKDNPEFASRGLKMVEYACGTTNQIQVNLLSGETLISAQAVEKASNTKINLSSCQLLDYNNGMVSFDPPNDGEWLILLFIETFSGGTIRGIHFGQDDGEAHAPPSADLLNPEAVKKFIHLTHDTYYEKLQSFFGNTIMAMFTDEPDILGRGSAPGLVPWTSNFLSFYKSFGNEERHLPALWFDAGEKTAKIRKRFRKTVNEKLTEAYYKQISQWCERHEIALTGHPAASDDIGLLEHFQIPGQDVVWRWVAPEDGKALQGEHSTAGKCSADAARHRGRRRNLNEVLGVCGKDGTWALSPGDMKWYFDWLLVRGVNLICPHAFYYSIEGKRRSHERPPDVGPNNLWWPYYKQIAQYIKRVSWLMTDSTNQTAIAVLCEEDHLPWKIVKPLYENQVEFNYLEESLLLSSSKVEGGTLNIANQSYRTVLIEESKHLETEVIQKLEVFIRGGGTVVSLETDFNSVINGAVIISEVEEVLNAIPDSYRNELTLEPSSDTIRVSKVTKNGNLFYFFVNEGEEKYEGTFRFKEQGKVEKWDPWDASIGEASIRKEADVSITSLTLNRRSSVIYRIDQSNTPTIGRNDDIPNGSEKYIAMNEQWKVKNAPDAPVEASLSSWSEWKGMETFSGTLTYENHFDIVDKASITHVVVDLGEVHEIAKVSINNQQVGVKMWAPYQFEVDLSRLQNGTNDISVAVTNSMANKMDESSLKSGLIGPVSLRFVEKG